MRARLGLNRPGFHGGSTEAGAVQEAPLLSCVPMARPSGDPVEIATAPTPGQSPFIPTDARIVVGAVAPTSSDPIPIVLLPGFGYRLREWLRPDDA